MNYLDLSLTLGSIWFNYGFIPQLLNPNTAVPRSYSIPSALIMIVFFVIPEIKLGLIFSPISSLLSSVGFIFLAVYKSTKKVKYES